MTTLNKINTLIENMPAGGENETFLQVYDLLITGILNGEISADFVDKLEHSLEGAMAAHKEVPHMPESVEEIANKEEFITKLHNIVTKKLQN